MATYLLDADTLSYILRKHSERDKAVLLRLRQVLSEDATVILCPMSFYEVFRGLLHRNAPAQIRFLMSLSVSLSWSDLQRDDWEAAAHTWADCTGKGQRPGDADTVIAAHAARHNAVVVTNNEAHFRLLGVPIENWAGE